MLKSLFSLFSKGSAKLSDDSRMFIEKLAVSEIWILAIGIHGTPAIASDYDSSKLDLILMHLKELSDIGDDDSVFPFNYRRDGQQILPFFSSEECARQFLAAKRWGVTSPFQPYRLLAGFVTAPGNEIFELILDPGLSSERRLLLGEKNLLRSLTTLT